MSNEHAAAGTESRSDRIQESPDPWPGCEGEAELFSVRFEDDLDRRKVDAFVERLAGNPLLELREAFYVIRDEVERARRASEPGHSIARRTAALFRGYGQVRNAARQYLARTVGCNSEGFGHLDVGSSGGPRTRTGRLARNQALPFSGEGLKTASLEGLRPIVLRTKWARRGRDCRGLGVTVDRLRARRIALARS